LRGILGVNLMEVETVSFGYVSSPFKEIPPRGIADTLAEVFVLDHIGNAQGFSDKDVVFLMMNFNIFQLLTHETLIFLAILSCGLYTGYTDFRYGKIANIYTLGLLILGVMSQALFVVAGEITWGHSCIILFGGLGISFAMFYTGIWAAGDAKLFWGLSLLMPPSVFSRMPETQFYPLILIVNIFVLFLIYVTLKSIFKIPLQQQGTLISKNFMIHLKQFPRRILQMLSYIGVGGLAFYIPPRFGVELDLAIQLALFAMIAFAFNKVIERYIPEKHKIAFHITFLPLTIFFVIRSLIDLGNLIFFIFLISLFLLISGSFIRSLFANATSLKDLKPNMIPAERIVRIQEQHGTHKYIKIPANFANPAQDNIVVDVSSEGLTQKQIAHLHQLNAEGCLYETEKGLLIQEKIPFAFMIVLGTLVTFLAKGMIHSFIWRVEPSQILESVRLFFA